MTLGAVAAEGMYRESMEAIDARLTQEFKSILGKEHNLEAGEETAPNNVGKRLR